MPFKKMLANYQNDKNIEELTKEIEIQLSHSENCWMCLDEHRKIHFIKALTELKDEKILDWLYSKCIQGHINSDGHNLIHMALIANDDIFIQYLHKRDSILLNKLLLDSNQKQYTSLSLAILYGNKNSANFIIEYYFKNQNLPNNKGFYPIHIAAVKGQIEIIDSLIRAGIDVNQITNSNHGNTPLMTAIANNKVNIVAELIKRGAAIDIPNKVGDYPIHKVAYMQTSNIEDFKLMIAQLKKAGININQTTSHKIEFKTKNHNKTESSYLVFEQSLLHRIALQQGSDNSALVEKIKVLIQHDTDPYLLDNLSNTAFFYLLNRLQHNELKELSEFLIAQRIDLEKAFFSKINFIITNNKYMRNYHPQKYIEYIKTQRMIEPAAHYIGKKVTRASNLSGEHLLALGMKFKSPSTLESKKYQEFRAVNLVEPIQIDHMHFTADQLKEKIQIIAAYLCADDKHVSMELRQILWQTFIKLIDKISVIDKDHLFTLKQVLEHNQLSLENSKTLHSKYLAAHKKVFGQLPSLKLFALHQLIEADIDFTTKILPSEEIKIILDQKKDLDNSKKTEKITYGVKNQIRFQSLFAKCSELLYNTKTDSLPTPIANLIATEINEENIINNSISNQMDIDNPEKNLAATNAPKVANDQEPNVKKRDREQTETVENLLTITLSKAAKLDETSTPQNLTLHL